jgi:hypothetical protein
MLGHRTCVSVAVGSKEIGAPLTRGKHECPTRQSIRLAMLALQITHPLEEGKMKILGCFTIIILLLCGCTTFSTMQMSRSEVQERISHGDLIHSGDQVKIITYDGKQYQFKVISIVDGSIKGKDVEIPIKDIDLVEKRRISIGKTALLSGAVFLLFIMSQF